MRSVLIVVELPSGSPEAAVFLGVSPLQFLRSPDAAARAMIRVPRWMC